MSLEEIAHKIDSDSDEEDEVNGLVEMISEMNVDDKIQMEVEMEMEMDMAMVMDMDVDMEMEKNNGDIVLS